jgi:type IV pilus secretin PilQ/predicted competence protein
MGDVAMTRRWNNRDCFRGALSLLALGAMMSAGCSSAAPAPRADLQPAPSVAATESPKAPVRLTSILLREGAPGVRLDVQADGPLVWTSYRDSDGGLVVELHDTTPAEGVMDLAPSEGLLASLVVQEDRSGDRPLTRLAIRGRDEFEYNLASEDRVLELRLVPTAASTQEVARTEPVVAEQPLPLDEPVAPAVSARAAAAPAAGTPDQPHQGPAPGGTPAARLASVSVSADDPDTVTIVGDGEFSYATFRLENPERFVVDLYGVLNASARPVVMSAGAVVDRVRVAQFKPVPEPISRVVFDLKSAATPRIASGPSGLRLSFGAEASAVASTLVQDFSQAPPESPARVAVADDLAEEPAPPVAAPALVPDAEPEPVVVAASPRPETPPVAPTVAPPAVRAAQPPPSDVTLFEAADVREPEPTTAQQPVAPAFGSTTLGGGEKTYVGEPISLSLKDGDIKDVLRSFAQISGLNIIVQPGVNGTVTVELDSVPWDQALEQILKINGLGMQLEGNILRIAPVATLRAEAEEEQKLKQAQSLSIPLRTVIRRISYAEATDIASILQRQGGAGVGGSLMSQRGSVTVDERTNTLIIKELPGFMDTVIAVIENLDTPEPQVMIEARIIETTKRFQRSLGVEWGFDAISDAAHGNTSGLVFPNNGTANGGVSLLTGARNGFLDVRLGNILNTFNIDLAIQAAESEGLINVLSAPKVATLNNQSAEIQSGLQIPVQTVANNTVTVQFVNATLRLQVTPHVTAEGTVLMDINVQKREPQLAFAVVGATNAPIATKEAKTKVIVRDGGTTVIGGIYKVSSDHGQDRVPGLANIPLLGRMFRNNRRNDENEELLIFITPRVIKL